METTLLCAEHALGLDESHLVQLPDSAHRLLPTTAQAFCLMQQAAHADGLDLALASRYRSFARQQIIWDEKFNGQRPVLDAQSHPLDIHTLNDQARILAILRWSALPGTSRHHWGSDMDIYARQEYIRDPDAPVQPKGMVRRDAVSNLEIWCECFGKRKEDIKPADSYAIAAMMLHIEGWHKTDERKTQPLYGQQRLYRRV